MLLQAAAPGGGGGQSSGRPPELELDGSQQLPPTWTAHTTREGRIYYCNTSWFDYTLINASTPEKLLEQPNFDPTKKTVLFVPGAPTPLDSPVICGIIDLYLSADTYNVITLHHLYYTHDTKKCLNMVIPIGQAFGESLTQLISYGLPVDNIELVGHSLGGHIISVIANYTSPKLPLSVSLDPAYALDIFDKGYTRFTIALWTNSGGVGHPEWNGDVNLVANDGMIQPYCKNSTGVFCLIRCHHLTALEYWGYIVMQPNLFYGIACNETDCNPDDIIKLGPNIRHVTHVAGWLPPAEKWETGDCRQNLPYGWEQAIDAHGKSYFINHVNKTTTYEAPIVETWSYEEVPAPKPRHVTLIRSPTLGFGFVAGSEKPVIVRFVTEDGPSVDKLQPGDEILSVNGEDVKDAPREKVISMVRSSESTVDLVVCQPVRHNYMSTIGRKSTLLSASKRARLKARPSRVRFAESVCVNGAPLFPPSAFSLGEMCAPPMANVLKVFLENGQTKSFKYDANTTVQDVVTSLQTKLCLNATEHFSLVVEHIKSLRRNKLTLLDPQDTLARIASRPGAHKLRCLFRVSFVPVSVSNLAQRDPAALDYLFAQCCNDVTAERFAPELQPEAALRLAALHMHQHALVNNMPPTKLTVKSVEREFGLERFIPPSLLENMKRKEIRRLISHFLRSYSSLGNGTPSQSGGGKSLTPLQAKLLYLDLVSQLPSYGAKCFSTGPPRIATPTDCIERVLLVSPRFGLSQIAGGHNNVPVPIARLEDMKHIEVKREDDINSIVTITMSSDRTLLVSLEERDACELALVLQGYHQVLTGKLLPVDREREPPADDLAPPYLAQHNVVPAKWSYIDYETLPLQRATFISLPKYHMGGGGTTNGFTNDQAYSYDTIKRANAVDFIKPLNGSIFNNVDNNMNNQMSNKNQMIHDYKPGGGRAGGYDLQSVVSMEILESGNIVEARNEEVIRRVQEMQELVENSEQYLTEQEQYNNASRNGDSGGHWTETNLDIESDSDSQMSGMDDAPGVLKHSDSLLLLSQNHLDNNVNNHHMDLSILTDALQSESDSESFTTPNSSPIHYNNTNNKPIRTSFGLHSPDNNCKNEQDLKEYLRQLRKHAQLDENMLNLEDGLDIYDLDPDIIDLTLLPPPQTPDELDDLTNISNALNVPPSSFADSPTTNSQANRVINKFQNYNNVDNWNKSAMYTKNGSTYSNMNNFHLDNIDLDEFLASVAVKPPTQQLTPAVELTPEEILSYIIPPPPSSNERPSISSSSTTSSSSTSQSDSNHQQIKKPTELKRRNSDVQQNSTISIAKPVIDYSTVDRKGAFSCCGKGKQDKSQKEDPQIQPPPRNSLSEMKPPDRPPKTVVNDNRQRSNSFSNDIKPPILPPRDSNNMPNVPPHLLLPPKKPPLPPVPSIELRNKIKSPAPILKNRTAGIGSPHLQRNQYKDIEDEIESPQSVTLFVHDKKPIPADSKKAVSTPTSPHLGRNSKLSSVAMEQHDLNNTNNHLTTSSPLTVRKECLYRKNSLDRNAFSNHVVTEHRRTLSSVDQTHSGMSVCCKNTNNDYNSTYSHARSNSEPKTDFSPRVRETLLTKSDVALAGLLVRLDQIAAQCSAAQARGGGRQMCEDRFQMARDELTSQSLQLVTSSKCVVVSMACPTSIDLPEHLAACLTILRRLTELSQDLSAHTTAPLQTRNLILKVHSVTAAFRDLISATIVNTSPEQLEEKLAHHAECLANVLATLLRSLRVFSP